MAVPKKRRSRERARKRRFTIFYDQLVGNWNRRREWFYRRLYQLPLMPHNHISPVPPSSSSTATNSDNPSRYTPSCSHQQHGDYSALQRPFRFHGFWNGTFAYQVCEGLKKLAKKVILKKKKIYL